MNLRKTVSVNLPSGKTAWFPVADASNQWQGRGQLAGTLYEVRGRWVLLDELVVMLGGGGKVISPEEALEWLTLNGHLLPASLAEVANRTALD